jgi:hypothetical protein
MLLVSRQTLLGTGFNTVGLREAFHGLGVQDVAEFNTGCCSVFCFLKEKIFKKGETARRLFSQDRYILLAVPCQYFPTC